MSLKRKTLAGIRWTFAAHGARHILQLLATLLLVALLTPEDFGLVGMAMVVIGFARLFHDLGTTAAIIQRRRISSRLVSSVYWMNVALGCFMAIVIVACSPLIALMYDEPRVVPILCTLGGTFVIASLSAVHCALLRRRLRFASLAQLELCAMLVGAAGAIIAAMNGAGAWALVLQHVLMTTMTTICALATVRWRPRMRCAIADIRSLWGYSASLTGYTICNYCVRNADNLIIGIVLGPTALGYYTLAYKLMLYPIQNVSAVFSRVMFPVYSRVQEDLPRLRQAYLRVNRSIALFSVPLMSAITILSTPFVAVFFGDTWAPVAPLLAILAPVGLFHSLHTTVGPLYQASGRTGVMFIWGLITGIVFVVAFIIGVQYGVQGVALAYAAAALIVTAPNFLIPFRFIQLRLRDYGRTLWRPFACSGIMIFVMLIAHNTGVGAQEDIVQLILQTIIGIAAYFAASLILNRREVRDFVHYASLRPA